MGILSRITFRLKRMSTPASASGRKENCLIYGNCVAEGLHNYLLRLPAFNDRYHPRYVRSFVHPTLGGSELSTEEIKTCSLLIFQRGGLQYPPFFDQLPPTCRTISFPILRNMTFWPFYQYDKRNRFEPENGFLFGRFPYGDSQIIQMIQKNIPPEEILVRYKALDITRVIDLDAVHRKYREFCRELDNSCDLPVFKFMADRFFQERFFWTPNHPAAVLMIYQLRQLVEALELDRVPEWLADDIIRNSVFNNIQLPIHPQIVTHFNLQWVDPAATYNYLNNQQWTFDEYIKNYIFFK